jgi:hypothetical protein
MSQGRDGQHSIHNARRSDSPTEWCASSPSVPRASPARGRADRADPWPGLPRAGPSARTLGGVLFQVAEIPIRKPLALKISPPRPEEDQTHEEGPTASCYQHVPHRSALLPPFVGSLVPCTGPIPRKANARAWWDPPRPSDPQRRRRNASSFSRSFEDLVIYERQTGVCPRWRTGSECIQCLEPNGFTR